MQQRQSSNQTAFGISVLGHLFRHLVKSQSSTAPDELPPCDCMLESDDEATRCGGYNDAFIVQYWSSYNPRH